MAVESTICFYVQTKFYAQVLLAKLFNTPCSSSEYSIKSKSIAVCMNTVFRNATDNENSKNTISRSPFVDHGYAYHSAVLDATVKALYSILGLWETINMRACVSEHVLDH